MTSPMAPAPPSLAQPSEDRRARRSPVLNLLYRLSVVIPSGELARAASRTSAHRTEEPPNPVSAPRFAPGTRR
jgi:hypothetical protein